MLEKNLRCQSRGVGFPLHLFLASQKLPKAEHGQTTCAAANSNDAEKQEGGEDSQGEDRGEEEELWETEDKENMKIFIDPQPIPESGTLQSPRCIPKTLKNFTDYLQGKDPRI